MAIVAGLAAAFVPAPSPARTLTAGTGGAYATPSAAVAAARDGDTVTIAPGTYFDCAVAKASRLTIEGAGASDAVVLTDKACMGKALLVVEGNDVTVRHLTLTRARVPDGNGAGIRAEGRNLAVEDVRFVNDQDGLLSSDSPGSTITVTNSLFDRDGVCMDACAHAIYVGRVARLRVNHSRFIATREGHDVKSRASVTEVTSSKIEDGPAGTSSYLIEAPNGGSLTVTGNILEKGPLSGNHTAAIAIGTEGVDQPTPEITVTGNRLANDGQYRTFLVRNLTATEARLQGNVLSGNVRALQGDGSAN